VASKSLVYWLKILWENWRASAWRSLSRVVFCWALLFASCVVSVSLFVPRGKGVRPPFIDQGRSESHARRAI
jgi:hypothetical protein